MVNSKAIHLPNKPKHFTMKANKLFIGLFLIVGLVMIIGGYKFDQGGTVLVGFIFAIFGLVCNRLSIRR